MGLELGEVSNLGSILCRSQPRVLQGREPTLAAGNADMKQALGPHVTSGTAFAGRCPGLVWLTPSASGFWRSTKNVQAPASANGLGWRDNRQAARLARHASGLSGQRKREAYATTCWQSAPPRLPLRNIVALAGHFLFSSVIGLAGLLCKPAANCARAIPGAGGWPAWQIIMRALTVPQTGKQGTTVAVLTRYGQVLRQYIKPKDPHSPAQMRIRSNLGRVSARWRVLTPEQRQAWTIAAGDANSRPRLGKSAPLTGCQFFIKINCARAAIGLEQLSDRPALPQFGRNPVEGLAITNTRGNITLKLDVPTAPESHVTVYGAAPCSAGISFVRDFTILGPLPEPARGVSDITDIYVARYGVPRVGSQVFIRTRQQINGWEDQLKQVSAIVPKG